MRLQLYFEVRPKPAHDLLELRAVSRESGSQCFAFTVFANSLSSRPRASSVSHSPSTMPHFGQSIRYTNSPLLRAPNVKFGGTLQVEQIKIIVPFRALI